VRIRSFKALQTSYRILKSRGVTKTRSFNSWTSS